MYTQGAWGVKDSLGSANAILGQNYGLPVPGSSAA